MTFREDDRPVTRGELRDALEVAIRDCESRAGMGNEASERIHGAVSSGLEGVLCKLEESWRDS